MGWNATGLNGDKVATDSIKHWLKHCYASELVDRTVQNKAAKATDAHGNKDGGPASVEDLLGYHIFLGQVDTDWYKQYVCTNDCAWYPSILDVCE